MFKFVTVMHDQMSKSLKFDSKYCLRARITAKGTGHANSDAVFLFPEVYHFIGVLHSSSFPDYIEDKKSGGQQTDCLNKNLCNDSTINTGLADRMIKQMLKTVMRG